MALQRISNELYMDFELYAKIVQARINRGLNVFSRSSHQTFVKLCQDAMLNEHLNQLERTENRKLDCLNFKK
jgi:hypothetical protein